MLNRPGPAVVVSVSDPTCVVVSGSVTTVYVSVLEGWDVEPVNRVGPADVDPNCTGTSGVALVENAVASDVASTSLVGSVVSLLWVVVCSETSVLLSVVVSVTVVVCVVS